MALSGATPSKRIAAEANPASTLAASRPGSNGGLETDPDAFLVATFNQLRDELVSSLFYILGNSDDAQDAAQEAFLKCWRARASIPDIHNLRAWIFRVGMNAAKDYQRSAWSRRSRPLPEDHLIPVIEKDHSQSLEEQESIEQLQKAILLLRVEEKEVFLMRQNGDLTYEQIAEIRATPVGTVKTQMRSALQKLRKALNPEQNMDDE